MFKKILGVVVIITILAQFISPQKNSSKIIAESDFIQTERIPERLGKTIKQSCYDCHSNHTEYPWYNSITPVNFWLNGHINHAKKDLNFSEWNSYSAKKKLHKLNELSEVLLNNEMPPTSYNLLHADAKISEDDKKALLDWIALVELKYHTTNLPM